MRTEIAQTHVAVTPGQPARVEIDVTNTSDVIDGVTAIVDGINPDWVRLDRPLISLFPDATDRLGVIFDIPRTCPAGDYLVVVRVASAIDPERNSVHDFWLTVGVVDGVDVELRPSIVSGGGHARFEAIVTNTGNAPAEISISALEPTRVVDCRAEPGRIVLGAGAEAVVPVDLKGPRPWLGQQVPRQIHVGVSSGTVAIDRVATFNQRPRIPRGLITAFVLACIVALWALIFLWVVTEMRSQDPPAKATGTDLFTGPANISLAAIAGQASGTVTASTTGEGVARITVEAWRVKADGTQVSVASAATDDAGEYVLPTLIPGDYRFRFTAEGYSETWYTAPAGDGSPDADPGTGSIVRVAAQRSVTGLDIALAGNTGSLSGQIALPPGSAGTPLTVTATLVSDPGPAGDTSAPAAEPQTFSQTTTDGSIALDGLPTPGTFQVTITGDGFDTQSFQAAVGGGQAALLDTVTLGAAEGTITGIAVDAAGTPLGGVSVVARAGDTEVRATTPTSGQVGSFQLIGLTTPETYVLTFSKDGYSGQTVALSLPAGGSQSVQAQLIGGSGTVTGTVLGPDGTPLGGVTVAVSGDGFTGQTTTLTTNGAGGGAGSYTVTGLPVPGVYTITFTADGYLPETLGAGFLAAGTQPLDTVTLLPEHGVVAGVVRSGGGGLGEVTVTLTDGTTTRTTTSATAPAGQYSFADVPAGWYAITFGRPGYTTRVVQVEVLAGAVAARDVELAAAG